MPGGTEAAGPLRCWRTSTPADFTRPLLEEYQLQLFQHRSSRTGEPLAIKGKNARPSGKSLSHSGECQK